MIIKAVEANPKWLVELEALLKRADRTQRSKIKDELHMRRAGHREEKDSAYLIDFEFGQSADMAVIHDVRIDIMGRNAQIDHLLIHRSLACFVLETKHFAAGLKITDTGEFLKWDGRKKTYTGMPSPLAQNERHIAVLQDLFATLPILKQDLPNPPQFHSYILVSPKARIDRSPRFDSHRVIKADLLSQAIRQTLSLETASAEENQWVSSELLNAIGNDIARCHRPVEFDYARKFGITDNFSRDGKTQGLTGDDYRDRSARRQHPSHGLSAFLGRLIFIVAVIGGVAFAYTKIGLAPLFSMTNPQVSRNSIGQEQENRRNSAPMNPTPRYTKQSPTSGNEPAAVRVEKDSLSIYGSDTQQIGELRGNLPQIRQEMQHSRLGGGQARKAAEDELPPNRCDPKAVMTDAEIAACRH